MATGAKRISTITIDSFETTPEVIVNSVKTIPEVIVGSVKTTSEVFINSTKTTEEVCKGLSISPSGTVQFKVIPGNYQAGVVTVSATYNSSATSGVRVRWLYSPDDSLYDSPEDAEDEGNYKDLTFSAGETRTRTIIIPYLQPYVRVQIVNLDSSYSVTVDCYHTFYK